MRAVLASTGPMIAAIITISVFIATVIGQNQCKNGTLWTTENAHYLTSPNYPSNYENNMNCQWNITPLLPLSVIVLKVMDLHLEGTDTTCLNDFVAIYDGNSINSPRLKLLCGNVSNVIYISSNNSMILVFHSDSSINYKGFQFEYTSKNKSALCGETNLWANETAKYIISPGYPNNYPHLMNCQWLITTNLPSNVIQLKLVDFYLEDSLSCFFDYVIIYDGNTTASPKMQRLCGLVPNATFTSTSSSMTIVFRSDVSNYFNGFMFEYTSQGEPAQCGDVILWANENEKYITSPDYPNNYPGNAHCQWFITASLPSSVVVLMVMDFNVEDSSSSCINDSVTIYDGTSNDYDSVEILCGPLTSRTYTSTGQSLTVMFQSNSLNSYRGFKFRYTSIAESAQCADVILTASETVKYITSPGYPKNYPNNANCQWRITTYLTSHVIVLKTLEFITESILSFCSYDFVTVYDGNSRNSAVIKSLCGQVSQNTTIVSTGSSMTIVFHSDGFNNFKGFKFEYKSQNTSVLCGETNLWANENTKSITSPGYPNNYQNNMYCKWQITASLSSKVVMLKVLDFSLEVSSLKCNYDNVTIYDGNSIYSPRIGLLCDQALDKQFKSTGPYMTVVFRTDSSTTNRGFNLQYTTSEKPVTCEDVTLYATSSVNYLTSPNYPSSYPRNTDCRWHITTGSSSSYITLMFSQIELGEYESYCSKDYVKIYDGPSTVSRQIEVLCGQLLYSRTIDSTGSDITIVFHSDREDNDKGFSFSYYSNIKVHFDTGLSASAIVGIVIGAISVPCFIVAIIILIKRIIARKGLRNTQNMMSGPNYNRQVAVSENVMYFVSQPNMNPTAAPTPYVGIVNSQNTYSPPQYSSLNFNVNPGAPIYAYSVPGTNVNTHPPTYSSNLPGGPAHQEAKSGAHLNMGFNFANSDEVMRYHMTGQNVPANINLLSDTSMGASAIAPFPQSNPYAVPVSLDNNLPSETPSASK